MVCFGRYFLNSDIGRHNSSDYTARLEREGLYKDCSTICIIPTRGVIPAKVVENWLGMMTPMNQKFMRMFVEGMEVGAAYSHAINNILNHPELSKWKYVLTLEEDNIVPPDGLLKLIEHIGEYDAIGGLYWTKGECGQPMCYGDPAAFPKNFIPQIPVPNSLTPCNGLGMGFTLFKLDVFRNENLPKPIFETRQVYTPGVGVEGYTQDLKFFENAGKLGYKFACDASVLVGHFDINTNIVW